jgi:hypothetical protein
MAVFCLIRRKVSGEKCEGRDFKADNEVFEESIPTFGWRDGAKTEILPIGYPAAKTRFKTDT